MNYDSLAQLYVLQYANYRDDLAFYARLAERLGAAQILELGAGTGRVSVPLARRGFVVTALEPSPKMLGAAKAYATAENVRIEFVKADARDFDLGRQFPLIIAPFNMLMHLYTRSDQDAALACIQKHLEPGGVFAFDLYQPHFALEGVLRHEGETFVLEDGARLDVFVHQRIDRLAQMCYTTYFCDTTQPSGALSRQVLTLEQRYFTRFELERWLSGFRLEWYGDFSGGRLEAHSPH
ncbi:MAG: class I SAM-dependent methyltransferase, partial [Deinococcales bacterium]